MPTPQPIDRATCATQHFGAWAIEPQWFAQAIDAVKSGKWKAKRLKAESPTYTTTDPMTGEEKRKGYYEIENGIAVISVRDHITKHQSSFGGTSSVMVRKALRYAVADRDVRGIMLRVDSPGGTVRGTQDLGDEVKLAGQSKPVHAHIEDLGASAAYWVACASSRLTANRSAQVGSIGTYATLVDDTGAQAEAGVRYEIIASARYKGLGADGAITDDLREDTRREVDELNTIFLEHVKSCRGLTDDQLAAVSDGRVHIAANAQTLRLIDAVESFDEAMAALSQEVHNMDTIDHVRGQFPKAAAALVAEGENKALEAMTPTPAKLKDLNKAFGAHPDFILTLADGEPTLAESHEKFAAWASAQMKAKDEKIAELEKKLANATSGQQPLQLESGGTEQAADSTDPKAIAEAEWAKDPKLASKFSSKDRYVAIRKAELTGKFSMR